MLAADYVIVGSGLTGAVIARYLSDAGKRVIVVERRSHVGGNVADFTHPSGIQIHRYGPHFFRTTSDEIWRFVNRFADFHPYRHQVKSRIQGRLENWPVARSYIERICGANWRPVPTGHGPPSNFEEAALRLMPCIIYEQFVKGYTEKQWGVPASALSPSLCNRFDVRDDDDPFLHPKHRYQGIPTEGYTSMMERMLRGIPVVLNVDFLAERHAFRPREMLVFTGPIDEYFNYSLGRLAYRGQKRSHIYQPEIDWSQPCAQINEPSTQQRYIREIEWKYLMHPEYAARIRGSVVSRETPWSPHDPDGYEYPFPDTENQSLFSRYQDLAKTEPTVLICGRLGEYRYYDMDHAIGRALTLGRRLLNNA